MTAEAQRRDRFRTLYDDLHDDLWRYCARRVWPAEDAEDLLADVLVVIWRRLDDVPDPPDQRAWAFGVARNHVRERARRRARRARLSHLVAEAESHPAEPDAEDPRVPALRRALERLSEADAEILRLAVWDELTHREIAAVLECREGAVAVRLHRARRRLARHLEQGPPGERPLTAAPSTEPPPPRDTPPLREIRPLRLAAHDLTGDLP